MEMIPKPEGNPRVVDMAIWLDANMHHLADDPISREMEDKIVTYLFWMSKSIAISNGMFKRYEYYDEFALYATGIFYNTLKKKIVHQGQVIRGKVQEPIVSVLNYINYVLPKEAVKFMKDNFDSVLNPALGHNTEKFQEEMRDSVRCQYKPQFEDELREVLKKLPTLIWDMLIRQCPYRNDSLMLHNIYISCLLSFNSVMTLPNAIQKKLNKKILGNKWDSSRVATFYALQMQNNQDIVLWHLPEHMKDYIRILVVKCKRLITDELGTMRKGSDLSDEVVDSILATAFTTYDMDQGDF